MHSNVVRIVRLHTATTACAVRMIRLLADPPAEYIK